MRRKSRGINKFLPVQGSKFSSFSGSGIKLLGKNMGSVTKKYTSLRPCYLRTRNRTRKPLKQKEAGFLPTIKVRMSKNDVNVYKQETSLLDLIK